jgi:hypothetical protein
MLEGKFGNTSGAPYLEARVSIPRLSTHNHRFPSLLGRDIIDQWRFVMDRLNNQVSFTPRKWDLRKAI